MQTIKTALLSLRMLLEFPNAKDPQDAEVAKMMLDDPEGFAQKAHSWAVKYAGAPRCELDLSKYRKADGGGSQPSSLEQRCVRARACVRMRMPHIHTVCLGQGC